MIELSISNIPINRSSWERLNEINAKLKASLFQILKIDEISIKPFNTNGLKKMRKKHGFSTELKTSQSLDMKEIQGFSLNFLNFKILKIPKFYALVSLAIKGLQRTPTMFGDLRDRTPCDTKSRQRVVLTLRLEDRLRHQVNLRA